MQDISKMVPISSKLVTKQKELSHAENDEPVSTSVNGSKSKRKSQDVYSHSHSKGLKISDHKKTPTKFVDMNDDVIEMILCHLELVDLAKISDTNKRLKSIAAAVFSRKHGHRLICIDAFQYATMKNLIYIVHCKIKPIIRISEANVWFKLIRNFGKSIRYIRIESDHGTYLDKGNIPNFLKNVIEYILEYCADSLEVLELYKYPYLPLNKPLTKLQHFIGYSNNNNEAIEYMPNLRSLRSEPIPKILEKMCFSNLENIRVGVKSSKDVLSFISFMHINRQIRKLYLALSLCDYNDYDLLFSSINEILPQLKKLSINIYYKPGFTYSGQISNYHFEKIDNFRLSGYGREMEKLYGSFVFNDLKKFSLETFASQNLTWMNIVLGLKKLEILELTYTEDWKNIFPILMTELPELKIIIVTIARQNDEMIFNQFLGSEWKQIPMEKLHDICFTMKFQRIQRSIK